MGVLRFAFRSKRLPQILRLRIGGTIFLAAQLGFANAILARQRIGAAGAMKRAHHAAMRFFAAGIEFQGALSIVERFGDAIPAQVNLG